jgi:hypothetical protein
VAAKWNVEDCLYCIAEANYSLGRYSRTAPHPFGLLADFSFLFFLFRYGVSASTRQPIHRRSDDLADFVSLWLFHIY